MASTPAPTLIIFPLDGDMPARRVALEAPEVTIGREGDNTIVLADAAVSRRHVTITLGDDDIWRMRRQPTARPLYHNGETRDASPLGDGDQIVIGHTVLHVELLAPVETATTSLRTVMAPPPAPRLLVECPGIRFEVPLRQATLTLGRSPGVNIVVPSPVIGSRHATLRRGAGGLYTISAASAINDFLFEGMAERQHAFHDRDALLVGSRESGRYALLTYLAPQTGIQPVAPPPAIENGELIIGRDPESGLPLRNPTISWRHARLTRRADGSSVIEDLGSRNGTYVNYVALTNPQPLHAGDRVQIGPYAFVFNGVALAPDAATATGLRVDAIGLKRTVGHGATPLLNAVSLTIRPGEFVTIVGGSGAGKTTLLNALAGIQRAQDGQVLLDGVDSYTHYDLFRGRIGYVPQRDIVHKELTVEQALRYVARLRLPPDLRADELNARIDAVLETVEMSPRRTSVIARLSGGEQKRLSLAVELLAEPQILFLDEPNSALDPDLRGELQRTIRTLTARGHTVIMVSHFLEDIEASDRVAVMGRGGSLCYFGPPREATVFFQVAHLKDMYAQTNTAEKATAWRGRYERSPYYTTDLQDRQTQPYSKAPGQSVAQRATPTTDTPQWTPPARRRALSGWAQFWLLARRYTNILLHDRRRLVILLLQAPVIGAILALVSASHAFTSDQGPIDAQKALFFLAVIAIWFGASNAASEISKEGDIYQRERLAGLGVVPYLLSKVLVLGVLGALQTAMLLGIIILRTGLPPASAGIFTVPAIEIYIGMTLAGLAGLAMGLCVSAIASNPDKATGAIPLVLLPQILLAGIIFQVSGPMGVVADATISRWAVQALGTSADLNHLYYTQQRALAAVATTTGAPAPTSATKNTGYTPDDYDSAPRASHYTSSLATHASWADAVSTRRRQLLRTWSVVALLFLLFLAAAGVALRLKDPH